MKLFFVSLWLELRRTLFSKSFLILLLVMLLTLTGIFAFSLRQSSALAVDVGVVFSDDDPFALAIFDQLQQGDIAVFHALEGLSLEDAQTLITSRHYEIIYFLEPNLQEKMASGKLGNLVSSVTSEQTNSSSFLDELLFGAILSQASPYIAIREIEKILDIPPEQSKSELLDKMKWYQENNSYVEAITQWEGGAAKTVENARLGWVQVYHGVIAIFLFLYSASNLSSLIGRLRQIDRGLSSKKRPIYYLAGLFSHGVSGLLFGIIGLALFGQLEQALVRPFWAELAALFSYVFFLGALVFFLAAFLHDNEAVFSGVIFSLLSILLLGGTLFAPIEISLWLDKIAHLFPTYYYGKALIHLDMTVLSPLLLVGILLILLAFLIQSLRQKGKLL